MGREATPGFQLRSKDCRGRCAAHRDTRPLLQGPVLACRDTQDSCSHRGRAGFCKSGLGRCPCRDAACFQARYRPVGKQAFRDTRPFTRGLCKYWRPAQTMWERVHPRTPAQPVPCIASPASRACPLPQGIARVSGELGTPLYHRGSTCIEGYTIFCGSGRAREAGDAMHGTGYAGVRG